MSVERFLLLSDKSNTNLFTDPEGMTRSFDSEGFQSLNLPLVHVRLEVSDSLHPSPCLSDSISFILDSLQTGLETGVKVVGEAANAAANQAKVVVTSLF